MAIDGIPPLPLGMPIVDPRTGSASREFAQWWQQLFGNQGTLEDDLIGKADQATQIIAGTGLTGGGDLSADRTLDIDTTAEAERIRDVIGAALVAGANVTITVNDGADTITIAASGGGGGGPVSAQHWRLRRVQATDGKIADGLGLCAVDWLDSGGSSLIGSGTPSASNTASGWSPTEAFNGSTASGNGWYPGGGNEAIAENSWLAYDFGSAVTPAQVEFAPLTGYTWSVHRIVAIDYSDDGEIWTQHSLIGCRTAVSGVVETYDLP